MGGGVVQMFHLFCPRLWLENQRPVLLVASHADVLKLVTRSSPLREERVTSISHVRGIREMACKRPCKLLYRSMRPKALPENA